MPEIVNGTPKTPGAGQVMPDIFSPPTKRGRRPLVDISSVLTDAVESKGQWIRYELVTNRAKSMIRQLKVYDDVEVITQKSKTHEDFRVVYVRCIPDQVPPNQRHNVEFSVER